MIARVDGGWTASGLRSWGEDSVCADTEVCACGCCYSLKKETKQKARAALLPATAVLAAAALPLLAPPSCVRPALAVDVPTCSLQLVHTTMLHNFQLAQFVVLGLDVVHQYGEAAQSRRAAGVRRGPFARRADASAARQRAVHVWRATIFHQLAAHWCSAGLCWRHVGGHVHVLAYAPRPPTRASAIAPPTPALSGPGHARAAPALLQEWHPRCQPAGRTSRVAGPVLFACGDYLLEVRAHLEPSTSERAHTC